MEAMIRRIKELRIKNGLNQTQIGDYLGVGQTMIAKIEAGERKLTTDQMNKLCALFGCEFEYLMGESNACEPMEFAFRAKSADVDVLNAVAVVNRVILNMRMLDSLQGETNEK